MPEKRLNLQMVAKAAAEGQEWAEALLLLSLLLLLLPPAIDALQVEMGAARLPTHAELVPLASALLYQAQEKLLGAVKLLADALQRLAA